MKDRAVCVYAASSRTCPAAYHDAARRLGIVLAGSGYTIVYGGGGGGSMGALADGALSRGGRIIGILPRFMDALEWGHRGLTELRLVEDMRTRKHVMLEESSGVVALPGGCGTFEELLEAMTLKRLGIFLGPIVLVNTMRYFDLLLAQLRSAIDEGFMDPKHQEMWSVVSDPEQVPDALASAPRWSEHARTFAVR